MVKDITAILVQYTDQATLNKAYLSLKQLNTRLKSIIVLQEPSRPIYVKDQKYLEHVQYISIKRNDIAETLNEKIDYLVSPYLLFLQNTDYLSPGIHNETLVLHSSKSVLLTSYHNQSNTILHPLLVRTSFLKKRKFLSNTILPFKEAIFSAWLSRIEQSITMFKDNLIKRTRKNRSPNTIEKQKIMKKYQLTKTKTASPTMTIILSNYNMEKYVENAVASCLLQNDQPEQLLIIDDGSTDHSYQRLEHWDDGKQVKVFSKKNGGKARALNDLLPYNTSDFILELDADDWLDPDAVSVIKQYLITLPKDIAILYGNFRRWKQLEDYVLFKGIKKGISIVGKDELLSYPFPLGPRIYRATSLKREGGFPVVAFEDGRLYEDVSVLNRLINNARFCYRDFTVYNVREHNESITKTRDVNWNEFLKTL